MTDHKISLQVKFIGPGNSQISLFFLFLLTYLEEQQFKTENYDDVITVGLRHHATGLFL